MIKKLYPNGKSKAFNITYDDGVLQDIRFVELLNRYNLKGTFNLNSQLMAEEFRWQHESGITIKRLAPDVAVELYKGHEIASHTLTHPYMHRLSENEIMHQMKKDKENLENLFGCAVSGFAVPFSYYSPLIAYCAIQCGFEYARCSEERYSYSPPANFYWWAAGAYHINSRWRDFAHNFFNDKTELSLCQIVGHSYDLDTENMWEEMECFLQKISEAPDVISMTNIEIVRYLKAMENAEINNDMIINHSDTDLWFEANKNIVCVKPGEKYKI